MTDQPKESREAPVSQVPAGRRITLLHNFRSPVALTCFFLVAAVGLFFDLWTKHLAWEKLVAGVEWLESGRVLILRNSTSDVVVVPRWLEFTAVANQGAAMGLGQGRVTLFLIVSVLAVGVLLYFFALSGRRRLYQVVLGLLMAGVLGNFYDRLVHGYVRDMIHILPGFRWDMIHSSLPSQGLFPWVFNIADVFLCVGVVAVLVYGVLLTPDDPATSSAKAGSEPSVEPS